MKRSPVVPRPNKKAPATKLKRSEEALRIIEEYAAALREIIKNLRRKPH